MNGYNPTHTWQMGQLYRDSYQLQVDEVTNPIQAALGVWLLDDAKDNKALPIAYRDTAIDPPMVQTIAIYPSSQLEIDAEAHLADTIHFGELFELAGLAFEQQDQVWHLTLYWRCLNPTAENFTTFIHLKDRDGQLVMQRDSMPNNGKSPTSIWRSGDIIKDVYAFQMEDDSQNITTVYLGLYNIESGERLAVIKNGISLPDSAFIISTQ